MTCQRYSGVRTCRLVAVLVLAAVAISLAACAQPRPPEEESSIRGVVVSVTPGGEGGGALRVVWHESLGEVREFDSIDTVINEDSGVFDREGKPTEFAAIGVRDVVDVWISGPVAESYPPQAWAQAVRVLGEFDEIRPLPIPPGFAAP